MTNPRYANRSRFKLEDGAIHWNDLIKDQVKFDSKYLSDPILIREDGSLLYHLPSVIDDIKEGITHIIRGEDHISNTAFHIQIFKALNVQPPHFAHHPFLTDQEGKGFGKRIGSLSIENLRSEGYEDISIINYLLNIGSSEDIKPETKLDSVINKFDIKNIRIKNQKTRWGSCSSIGNLNFNWKLSMAPYEVIEYVVIHELCHRLEMNHSKKFWNHVEKLCPKYKTHSKWLSENHFRLNLN